MEVCNRTTITVEINGHSVSAIGGKGSTASSVAFALANKIASHPNLMSMVDVAVLNNEIVVQAEQEGIDFAYPWFSSCSYTQDFFSECAFWAERSPISTLVPPPE